MDTFFLFRLLLRIVEGRVGNGLFWNISEQKVEEPISTSTTIGLNPVLWNFFDTLCDAVNG